MRLVTWCEPEWDGKRWEVRQITEYFPNLFARLVLRRVAKTETRTFELKCDSRTNLDEFGGFRWMEIWEKPDGIGKMYLDDEDERDLRVELFDRVKCVIRTGSIKELMDNPDLVLKPEPTSSAEAFDRKVENHLNSALAMAGVTPGIVAFQAKLSQIQKERQEVQRDLAAAEATKTLEDMKNAPRPPRTFADLLGIAGVKTTPFKYQVITPDQDPRMSAIERDVLREAGKVIAFQNQIAQLGAEDHINYAEVEDARKFQEWAMAPGNASPDYTLE